MANLSFESGSLESVLICRFVLNFRFFRVTVGYGGFCLIGVYFERPDAPARSRRMLIAELFDIFDTFDRFDDLPPLPPGTDRWSSWDIARGGLKLKLGIYFFFFGDIVFSKTDCTSSIASFSHLSFRLQWLDLASSSLTSSCTSLRVSAGVDGYDRSYSLR